MFNFGNMNTFTTKDATNGILDIDMDKRTVKAVWARFGNVDLDNDIIVPEAVTKTIQERGPKGKNMVWSLVDHYSSMKHALGKPSELYVEGDMLIAVTTIIDTEIGEDIIKLYNGGVINQHSIGFSTIKSDWRDDKQDVRVIKELKLYEGSCVLWGANPMTPTLGLTKSEHKPTPEDMSKRLEALITSFKHGTFTDETFSLMEIEIKQIQSLLTTQAAAKAPEPDLTKEIAEQLSLLTIKLSKP